MQRYTNVAQDALGNVIQGMSVSVFLQGTQTLATIYSDNGITTKPNPTTTDALGTFFFYAANAHYDLQLTKTGLPTTQILDVILFDPGATGGIFVAGQVVFGAAGNTLAQDANLFWDNTNKRLGIDNAAPTTTLDVTGTCKISGTLTVNGVSANISNTTPTLFLTDSGWGSFANLQAGVNSSGTGVGNFLMFGVPTGKGFTFAVNNVSKASIDSSGNTVLAGTIDVQDNIHATARFPNIGTTAVAANATLNAVGSNDLLRSTSSMRYKTDIADLLDSDLLALDRVRLVRYRSASPSDDPVKIYYGMLAEDVSGVNPILTTTTKLSILDGVDIDVPDWVQYERFVPLLIEQGRRDRKRIAALEAKFQ